MGQSPRVCTLSGVSAPGYACLRVYLDRTACSPGSVRAIGAKRRGWGAIDCREKGQRVRAGLPSLGALFPDYGPSGST
jgi:hypothetical protein